MKSNRDRIAKAIGKLERRFHLLVVRIRWDIHEDHSGERALFLRIVFRDSWIPPKPRNEPNVSSVVTCAVETLISSQLEDMVCLEDMGLCPASYRHTKLESDLLKTKDKSIISEWGPLDNAPST